MEVFGAVAGQIGGLFDAVRLEAGGIQPQGQLHGTMNDVRLLVRGLNLLLVVVLVVIMIMSTSAILLDWAYWYRSVNVVVQEGGGVGAGTSVSGTVPPTGHMVVQLNRGDGFQVTILKAVVSSVVGFALMQLLRSLATPQNVGQLGRTNVVEQVVAHTTTTYRSAQAFLAARKAAMCFGAGAIMAAAAVLVGVFVSTWVAIPLALVSGVCVWAGATYGEQGQEMAVQVQVQDAEERAREEHAVEPGQHERVHIVMAGMRGAGKTSILKALMGLSRDDTSEAGTRLAVGLDTPPTPQEVTIDNTLVLHDMPGCTSLSSFHGQGFDVGVFAVVGSADRIQKALYDELKAAVHRVFVVRNKSEDLRRMRPEMKQKLLDQWRSALQLAPDSKIYCTCAFGYDPMGREDLPMDTEGVAELKADILSFLETGGRDIVVARHLKESSRAATGIIVKAVTKAAFGRDLGRIQQNALQELHFLYTGNGTVTVQPPEVHPAMSLWANALSVIPYVRWMGDGLTAAVALAMQLVAVQRALDHQAANRLAPELAQSYADNCAARLDSRLFVSLCEQVIRNGPAVYEGIGELLLDTIDERMTQRPPQQRAVAAS